MKTCSKKMLINTKNYDNSVISKSKMKARLRLDSRGSMNIDALTIRPKLTGRRGGAGFRQVERGRRWGGCTLLLTASAASVYARQSFSLPLWNELGEHENWADLQQSIMYEELGGSCWILPRWHQTVQPSGNAGRSLKTHYLW